MADVTVLPRGEACSVARTLDLVGDQWSLLLLREAFYGVRRFDELQHNLGIARAVLSSRLQRLVEAGVLRKVPYREEGARQRYEYTLTGAGVELLPALIGLMQWGDRHLNAEHGPPVLLHHRDCGAHVGVRMTCAQGHDVAPAEIAPRPGPGAP